MLKSDHHMGKQLNIIHYDLFAGIGGFSLALEEIFNEHDIKHIFCEWEQFPTAVLKKYWPEAEYFGDIADLVAHTDNKGLEGREREVVQGRGERPAGSFTIVTGGFPCQPFSHAGRRRGTADDRYQWPNMFAVIRNVKPAWVIAENVRGLVTWNDGLVLEQVCSDLESEGYEVQPLVITAVAVNAPHRRDRVWIIAHSPGERRLGSGRDREERHLLHDQDGSASQGDTKRSGRDSRSAEVSETDAGNDADTGRLRGIARRPTPIRSKIQESKRQDRLSPDWERDWREVAFATCHDGMDDGVRRGLVRLPDGTTISGPKWRQSSLKAYGNAIVPQVAMEIFRAIKATL